MDNINISFPELQKYFEKYPGALLVVNFVGIKKDGWESLFEWINPCISRLMTQHGVERGEHERMDLESYLNETLSYLVNFDHPGCEDICLLCCDSNMAEISFEQEDISNHTVWKNAIEGIKRIAEISKCETVEFFTESNRDEKLFQLALRK